MINFEHKHIVAILRSKLFNFLCDQIENESIRHKISRKEWNKLTNSEFDEIFNFIYDCFIEDAPVVDERYGTGDFGSFPIRIAGVRGDLALGPAHCHGHCLAGGDFCMKRYPGRLPSRSPEMIPC